MAEGWIRAWDLDQSVFRTIFNQSGYAAAKRAQARFRRDFRTMLLEASDSHAEVLRELAWGDVVELPEGIGDGSFTPANVGGTEGFIKTSHLVEIAYVNRTGSDPDDDFTLTMDLASDHDPVELLWGDIVQILSRDGDRAEVRSRGLFGQVDANGLTPKALLEIYIIDVGQGDGVLVRFPNGNHMLIDGGLARDRQMTGKNAADFVDWKFFRDYGHWRIDLDWMIASHSDADHYGGLHDLLDKDHAAQEELDCLAIGLKKFGHPGLSRFPKSVQSEGLGPKDLVGERTVFSRLMDDRTDAEHLAAGTSQDGLRISGWWRNFINSVLNNDKSTEFHRIGLAATDAGDGNIADLDDFGECRVTTLAPVTLDLEGKPALPDLGAKSINTNGHSVCLRLDFGNARMLMTGDLNTASMQWLTEAFEEDLEAWKCDVAKACHHGSADVSFKFLQAINAAATVISSGDNEGHAHPRPEVVAASALSGRKKLSPDGDRVLTPLVYMTEIERSVLLTEINRIEIENINGAGQSVTLLGKPVDEFAGREFMSNSDWTSFDNLNNPTSEERSAFVDDAEDRNRPRLEGIEQSERANETRATVFSRRPTGVVGANYPRRAFKRLRMMEANIYGLVNVRTDGELIMCASKRDDGESWTIHAFEAEAGVA